MRVSVLSFTVLLAATAVPVVTQPQFELSVVATGLQRPVGIAVDGSKDLYFTEVPNPGLPNAGNGVSHLDLRSGVVTPISSGEPEPTNLAVSREGDVYWTCKSAVVILRRVESSLMIEPVATGLAEPSGLAISRQGRVYFTEIPTPGVAGGANNVSVLTGNGKVVISMGEPEPTDVAVAPNGDLYWTCKTAGVILQRRGGRTSVLAAGLDSPSGIAIDHLGRNVYFTEVPTPGVPGSSGGRNKIRAIDLASEEVETLHTGDPEPTDIAVARNGNLYWTCTSAGVIVEAKRTGKR